MEYFVAEEGFLNKYLATLFEYNSWDLNIVALFFLQIACNYESWRGYQTSTSYITNLESNTIKKNAYKTKRTLY